MVADTPPCTPPAQTFQVRVGNPAKVRPELRSACLDAQVERTAQGRQAAQLREEADQLMAKVREGQQTQASWQEQVRAYTAAGNQLTPAQEQRLQQIGTQIRTLQRQADQLWRAADDNVKAAAIEVLRNAAVRGCVPLLLRDAFGSWILSRAHFDVMWAGTS